MSLSPHEIRNKRFMVALRGYDKEEVESFLGTVADTYDEVLDAANSRHSGAEVRMSSLALSPHDIRRKRFVVALREIGRAHV